MHGWSRRLYAGRPSLAEKSAANCCVKTVAYVASTCRSPSENSVNWFELHTLEKLGSAREGHFLVCGTTSKKTSHPSYAKSPRLVGSMPVVYDTLE